MLVQGRLGLGAAMEVVGAIAGDGGEPTGKIGDVAKRMEAREGLDENVLNEVFHMRIGNAGEKDAVDHTGIARVEPAEGGTVALLRGAHEGVVGGGGIRRGVHG